MRISDLSSDVCASALHHRRRAADRIGPATLPPRGRGDRSSPRPTARRRSPLARNRFRRVGRQSGGRDRPRGDGPFLGRPRRQPAAGRRPLVGARRPRIARPCRTGAGPHPRRHAPPPDPRATAPAPRRDSARQYASPSAPPPPLTTTPHPPPPHTPPP